MQQPEISIHPLIGRLPTINACKGILEFLSSFDLLFADVCHRIQQQFPFPEHQACTCEQNRIPQDPVWEQQIADYAYSNQKCGTCQQKSGIHQVFLNAFCHQNPFAHHLVSNRIQNIACQRRVTGCNITENTDKNKVQHYVGYRCRPCLNRKRAVF